MITRPALVVTLTIAIFLGIAAIMPALHPDFTQQRVSISDDGFYSLSVAKNLGTGKGPTIDGKNLTNGFQPLWVFMVAPIFYIFDGDRVTPLRAIYVLSALMFIFSAITLGKIAGNIVDQSKSKLAAVLTCALFLSSYHLHLLFFNGLETGLQILLLLLFFNAYLYARESRRAVTLGVLGGFLTLCRIDAVMILIAFVAVEAFFFARSKDSQRLKSTVLSVFLWLVVCSPWFAYNFLYFGSFMPSSGTAQQAVGFYFDRLKSIMAATFGQFIPLNVIPYPNPLPGQVIVTVLGVVTLILVLCRGEWRLSLVRKYMPALKIDQSAKLASGASIYALSVVLLAVWYFSTSFAEWHYNRYLALVSLPFLLGLGLFLAKWLTKGSFGKASVAILLVIPQFSASFLNIHLPRNPGFRFIDQVELAREMVPDAAIPIGAHQSGTLGYFRDNVVNLDGKVNAEALAYEPFGSEARLWQYLDQKQVDYVIDWPRLITKHVLGDDPRSRGWDLLKERSGFAVYRREK
jgi:hypothetical protein